jgi:protein-disulfide isomerase
MTSKGIALLALGIAVGAGGMWSVGALRSDDGSASVADPASAPASGLTQEGFLTERSKGDPDAPITILEASDFQCPYCRVFWEETLPLLEEEYLNTGKARLVFLNLPLPQLHPNAPAAHEFAMCAAVQDRFWPVHDLLFQYQRLWATESDPRTVFQELADSAQLNREALDECFDTGAVRELIQREAQSNFQSGLRSTPVFVIERGLLRGAQPMQVWRPILDSIFEAKK